MPRNLRTTQPDQGDLLLVQRLHHHLQISEQENGRTGYPTFGKVYWEERVSTDSQTLSPLEQRSGY
jgi:hypothetical protein